MGRYKVAADLAYSPILQQWFILPLDADRQSWGRPAGGAAVQADRDRAGDQAGRHVDPAADRGRHAVGRARGPQSACRRPSPSPCRWRSAIRSCSASSISALSMALALLAFGLWLRLGRLGKSKLRAAACSCRSASSSISPTPSAGERLACCASRRRRCASMTAAIAGGCPVIRAAYHRLGDGAAGAALILLWRSEATGGLTHRWFDWEYKWEYLLRMFRDRWEAFDIASRRHRPRRPDLRSHPSAPHAFAQPGLFRDWCWRPAMCCCRASCSAPPMPTCGWCRSRPRSSCSRFASRRKRRFPLATWLALAAVGFMLVRLGGNTASMAIAWKRQAEQLQALDHVERGSRVAVLVWDKCEQWPLRRSDHLGAIATVRKEAYTNDHWPMAGSTLMTRALSAGGLVPARSVADRPRSRLPARRLVGARRAQQSAARRVRLSVADRHAPDPAGMGRRLGAGLGRPKARSC